MTTVPVLMPWEEGEVTALSDGTSVVLRVIGANGGAAAKLDEQETMALAAELFQAVRDLRAGRVTEPPPTG